MFVAITGGIGAGKSHVCRLLAQHGIQVYDCDAAAKRLMRTSPDIRQSLCRLVGNEVYAGHAVQKSILAAFLLQSEQHKQAVNNIVHPAVARDFIESGMQWLESAILFESGFDRRVGFSHVVCVTAPIEVRISRVMKRDGISRDKTLEWIGRQMPQEEMLRRSHFEIVNDGQQSLPPQIDEILKQINHLKV